jgi:hypothetical protein
VFHKVVPAARVMRQNAGACGLVQQKELGDLAVSVEGLGGLDKFDDVARYLGFRGYREMISSYRSDSQ